MPRLGSCGLGAAVFGIVFVVHSLSPVDTVYDSRWTLPVAMSLIRHGDTNLDEYPQARADLDWRIEEVGGHRYNFYPLGPALVALPFVWATSVALMPASIDLEEVLQRKIVARLEVLVAALLVALNALLLWYVARRELSDGEAALLALVFAFATPAWSSASRALWQHAPAMLFMTLIYVLLLGERRPWWRVGLAGAAAATAYLMRPTSAPAAAIFAVAVLLRQPRQVVWYVLGMAAVLAPWLAFNLSLYGRALPAEYSSFQNLSPHAEGFVGTLFCPSRGLLIYSPVLLFCLWGGLLRWRASPQRTLDRAAAVLVLVHWMLISCWVCWYGGACLGPRLMCDAMPFACLLLIPVLAELRDERRRRLRLTFGVLLAVSVAANGDCAANWGTADWNHEPCEITSCPQRLWDLGDLQLLRLRHRRR